MHLTEFQVLLFTITGTGRNFNVYIYICLSMTSDNFPVIYGIKILPYINVLSNLT